MGSAAPAHAQGVAWGGFIGAYQAGLDGATAPAFQRRDARIDFAWNAAGPGGSTSPEFVTSAWPTFSASWTGTVIPATTETYSFRIQTSDAVSFSIRPTGSSTWTTLINDWATAGKIDVQPYALVAGKSYDIALHYYQHGKSGAVQLGWSSPTVPFQVIDAATPLGINSSAVLPGEPGNIFADVVKQAKPFGAYSNSAAAVALDANGWPLADASMALWASGREMNGTYQVTFNGQAKLVDWTALGSFSVGGVSYGATLPLGTGYNAATNTTTAQWTIKTTAAAPATIGFAQSRRTATSAVGSGITNLHIMRPLAPGSATAHAAGELFSAQYKSFLSYFTGIRFMDYLATNGNRQANWTDRVKPTDATQYQPTGGYGWQGKGASWEYLVELANETGKDAWINIPVYASDDYVTKLARLFAFGSDGVNPYTSKQANPVYPPLNSNLKVYIEYSNELWNTSFQQYNSNVALAEAEVAAGTSSLDYDKTGRWFVWERRRAAKRIMEVSNLFRAVWGDAAMMTQIRPVFEWQYGNMNQTAAVALDFLDGYYNNADGVKHVAQPHPVNYFLYGGGGGWYVAPVHEGLTTAAAIFASGTNIPATQSDALWANAFGLKTMGYEGGFEVGGDTGGATAVAANLDPGALPLATKTLTQFFQQGGTMPFVFNAAGATSYGVASPTINEQNTPKMQAILALDDSLRPSQQIAGHVPGIFPYQSTSGVTSSGYVTGAMVNVGDYLGFSVTSTAGTYTITTDAKKPAAVRILVDNVPVGTGTWTGALSSGVHGIRLQNLLPGGTSLTKLVVTQPK
ncbi:MAG TPA: PA14 domain-containing protein [Aliidongia sp.]|uniref:PA14 domain-containing protein n=1 Tax=Aliidongia sp. TaxID=1914230 RepID=UPI002DDD6E3A|nr:PA14 domain-containing protein [Aliidongia sp.]HEV2674929.1 PA14 domain-containing protein [Aliidongia sp.]